MQPQTRKQNFFYRFFASFQYADFYLQVVQEPFKKALAYSLFLSFLLSLITGFSLSFEINTTYTYLKALVNDSRFPDIQVQDGHLQLSPANDLEIILGQNADFIGIIDSGSQKNYTNLQGYPYGVFINSDYLALKKAYSPPLIINFSQVGLSHLPKNSLQSVIDLSKIISLIFIFIFTFIVILVQYLFKSWFVFLILKLTFPPLKNKDLGLKFTQFFSVILYAMSLSALASELFGLIRIRSQLLMVLIIITLYMMTLRLTRLAITEILIDKLGKLPDGDDNDIWFRD